MGLPVARMMDLGIGKDDCHSTTKEGTGFILQGSGNVIANGLPVARMLDLVIFPDGHTGIIITGATGTITNGLPTARMTDQFVGCFTGIIIQGSPNVFAG